MKTIVIIFVNLFVLTVAAILLAFRLLDKRENTRIEKRLDTDGKHEISVVNLLKEVRAEEGTGNRVWRFPDIPEKLGDLLQQADVTWSVSKLVRIMGVLAAAGLLAGAVLPVLLTRAVSMCILGALGAALPVIYLRRAKTKRLSQLEKQLPDALDFLARSMRAGHAFSISIGMVGDDLPDPLGREFRSLFNEQNLGASLESAFAGFVRRVPLLDAELFCSAALLQRKTGGNLSELLNRLAEVVRERFRLHAQVKAASGHGRMTAGILSSMPLVTIVAMMILAPQYLRGLWDDEDGKLLIAAAIVAQVLGNMVIRKIVRIKV